MFGCYKRFHGVDPALEDSGFNPRRTNFHLDLGQCSSCPLDSADVSHYCQAQTCFLCSHDEPVLCTTEAAALPSYARISQGYDLNLEVTM